MGGVAMWFTQAVQPVQKIANKMFSLLIVPNAPTVASVKGRLLDDLPLGQLCAHVKEGRDLLVQHPLLLDTFLKGGDEGVDQLDSSGTVQLFLLGLPSVQSQES